MKTLIGGVAVALVFSTLAATAQAQVVDKKVLTLEGAKQVIAVAEKTARSKNAPGGAIAVVDEGGNLLLVERLDNTFAASTHVSIGKARTAAIFKHPTKFFEDAIAKGRTALVAMPDFTPLQGGIPIEYEGKIIGAIGVSGAMNAQQDEEIAIAGANALKSLKTNPERGGR
ncbi:MAG: heme-binding protein [Iphinoe sp. HA4291-MV1]|jgi:glc operon protein GlcG|nr:heme-binding protein [Iphinoe sp. HA4291-MV1]